MIFFLNLTVRGPFHRKDFKWKKIWRCEINFWKSGSFVCRTKAATSSYSVTDGFLHNIFSVPVIKNHPNIRSRRLVHEFSFTNIFNDIIHGYRAATLKKNYLWLSPFFVAVATYLYYERCTLQLYYAFKHLDILTNLFYFKKAKSQKKKKSKRSK